jgi:hypothetical protein
MGKRKETLVDVAAAMYPPGGEATSKKRIRVIDSYVPFPVSSLPIPLRQFVEHGCVAMGCDAAYIALPALAVLASCIGNTRVIRVKRGWHEPSVLWACVIGESGTLKTPAWRKAVDPLYHWQQSAIRSYEPLLEQWKDEIEAWNQVNKKNLKATATYPASGPVTPLPPKPVQPVLQRWIVSDTTIEKLAQLLEKSPRGLLLARDELGAWLSSFQRYRGKGSDLPQWLESFRAGPWIVDRKTGDKPTILVPHAAVSICGGITPGALRDVLSPEYLDHGLGARLLMAMPPRREKRWSEVCIPEDVENAYVDLLTRMLALDGDRDDQGELTPAAVEFGSEAKKEWIRFYNNWARDTDAAEGEMASALSKLEGIAARFALLHHTVTAVMSGQDGTAEIEPDSVQAGATLARWFANECRRVYATLSESREDRQARRLIEWIRHRGGSVTARELQQSNSRKYPSSEDADEALEDLVKGGWGEWKHKPMTSKGGQPARTFFLHPTPCTTDSTHPEEPPPDEETSDSTSNSTSSDFDKSRVFGHCSKEVDVLGHSRAW